MWDELRRSGERIATSNLVYSETLTFLCRTIGSAEAARAGRLLLEWPGLIVVHPARNDEMAALGKLEKYADQKIGYVDCVSFVLIEKLGIQTAFTFDRHFGVAGFSTLG